MWMRRKKIISSLEIRKDGQKYPAEIIPIRLSEIYQVNEAYEWVTDTVKTQLKKDFQGLEEDLQKIQDVIDSGVLSPKKKNPGWRSVSPSVRFWLMKWRVWNG